MKEKPTELTPQQRVAECQKEIEGALKKHSCSIRAIPSLLPRDDGTFSITGRISIAPVDNAPQG